MNTEIASEKGVGINCGYLQVHANVSNSTDQPMILTHSELTWGKWLAMVGEPDDVAPGSFISFTSQGRENSRAGTEGSATWKIGNAVITVNFSCPFRGSNFQSITCTPADAFAVSAHGTLGEVNICFFQIKPRSV